MGLLFCEAFISLDLAGFRELCLAASLWRVRISGLLLYSQVELRSSHWNALNCFCYNGFCGSGFELRSKKSVFPDGFDIFI